MGMQNSLAVVENSLAALKILATELLRDPVIPLVEWKQYFPKDQCTLLQNHIWVKDLLQMQYRPMGFDIAEYAKCTDGVSDSTLQQFFKNLLPEFQCNAEDENLQ